MAKITRIDVRVKTGSQSEAGTDGDVYIGIGGREFGLDSAADDFERGSDRTYILGEGSNVTAGGSPSFPYQLLTENLDRFPVYMRFSPKDRNDFWNLESVTATVNPGPAQVQFQALGGTDNLTLGTPFGLFCYLLKL